MINSRISRYLFSVLALMAVFVFASTAQASALDPVYPLNGALSVAPGRVTLLWEPMDLATYRIWFGQSAETMVMSDIENPTIPMADVQTQPGTTYFWKVQATTAASGDLSSSVWRFSTSDGPTAPEAKYPEDNAIDVSFGTITLQWTATGSGLYFDLYFGESATALKKVSSGLQKTLCDVSVSDGRKYFWQVVARDSNGHETGSQIWSFTTVGDKSIGGGCSISSSPIGLLLASPLLLLIRKF